MVPLLLGGSLTLDYLGILPIFGEGEYHDSSIMPCFNGQPTVSPSEEREYRALVLKHLREPSRIAPLFRSSAREIDLSELGISSSSVIADIGCGTGAFEVALLERRQPFARLYAVDIDERVLKFVGFTLAESRYEGRERVTMVHSKMDDVKLPRGSIDIAFMHNTRFGMRHGEAPLEGDLLRERDQAMISLKRSLKPRGKVFVYEPTYSVSPRRHPYKEEYISEPYLAHGFKRVLNKRIRLGEEMYFMVFQVAGHDLSPGRPTAGAAAPAVASGRPVARPADGAAPPVWDPPRPRAAPEGGSARR